MLMYFFSEKYKFPLTGEVAHTYLGKLFPVQRRQAERFKPIPKLLLKLANNYGICSAIICKRTESHYWFLLPPNLKQISQQPQVPSVVGCGLHLSSAEKASRSCTRSITVISDQI
ncbi:hypothetical protein XELAEV_18021225mg [Xenopus laevis]|uniref:Uncharacterized protein n=1 Tax=Xenopus laevis TaxID=8355 RepID=A0A974HRF1_XENLA|nr:hypothetical protein XELAEV_18021225mg [Xenopus laevis]